MIVVISLRYCEHYEQINYKCVLRFQKTAGRGRVEVDFPRRLVPCRSLVYLHACVVYNAIETEKEIKLRRCNIIVVLCKTFFKNVFTIHNMQHWIVYNAKMSDAFVGRLLRLQELRDNGRWKNQNVCDTCSANVVQQTF